MGVLVMGKQVLSLLKSREKIFIVSSSTDVDALCSIKILTEMLQLQHLVYCIVCVDSIRELAGFVSDNSDQPDTIIFCINIGGNIILPRTRTLLLVLDNYKPWATANLVNELGDDPVKVVIEEADQNESIEENQRVSRLDLINFDVNINDDQLFMHVEPNKHFKDRHYNGVTCWRMFNLYVKMVSRPSIDCLWSVICGVTNSFITRKINYNLMSDYMEEIKIHLIRINNMGNGNKDELSVNRLHLKSTSILNLFFVRHWSVMDILENSFYSACLFNVWSGLGKKSMLEHLIKSGLTIKQCQQEYSLLSKDLQKQLSKVLKTKVKKTKISQPYRINSFSATFGYQISVSAIDMALMVMLSLDCPKKSDAYMNILKLFDESGVNVHDSLQTSLKNLKKLNKTLSDILEFDYVICTGPFYLAIIPQTMVTQLNYSKSEVWEFFAKYLLSSRICIKNKKKTNCNRLILSFVCDENLCVIVGVRSALFGFENYEQKNNNNKNEKGKVGYLSLLKPGKSSSKKNESFQDENFLEEQEENDFGYYFDKVAKSSKIRIDKNFSKTNIIKLFVSERTKFLDGLVKIMK